MNELQWAAAKKAVIAVLVAICVLLLFRMSPILAIMLVFLSGIGFGTYMFAMDMEEAKIHKAEYEKTMEKIRKEHEEALDKIGR
jgi:hypothetical protein